MSSNTKVRLEVHASNLKNVAGAFKGTSDPFCIVTLLSSDPNTKPRVLGKTEVIKNSLSPRWTSHFDLDYNIAQNTRVNIGIWDEVRKGSNKPMGSALFEVGQVLGSRGNTKAKKLRKGGTLFCRIVPAPEEDFGTFALQLKGSKLKNVDGLFGKSDPFFEVSAKVEAAGGLTWQPVYRSKPIMNNLNPAWPAASLDIGRLCGGDLDRAIQIDVYDWEKSGKHSFMGRFETSVNGLLQSKSFAAIKRGKKFGDIVVAQASLQDYRPASGGGASSAQQQPAPTTQAPAPSGGGFASALGGGPPPSYASTPTTNTLPDISKLNFSAPLPAPLMPPTSIPHKPKFVDYVSGGCELELSIAIDFTGSNGDPRRPGTLHYRFPDGRMNDYEKAITAVGAIIARYDTDQKFPVFGFGAKYGGVIQHCFQIGGKPELDRISGVLEGYRNVFRTGLTMSGPTVFDEVIDYAAAVARSRQQEYKRIGKQAYNILLILTDGSVTDVERTKRSIQAASDAPLSIVIVGIGNADFRAMQELDDFLEGQRNRDIVQFVEFSKHAHNRTSLTQATLEEIPDQLVDYFHGNGIAPMPPVSGSTFSLQAEDPTDEDIDLNIDINEEGEINLADYDGTVYDDTQYGTLTDYSNLKPIPVPGALSSQPSAPYVPGSAPPPAYVPHPTNAPYNPSASTGAYVPSTPYTPAAQPTYSVPPPAPKPSYFHVQVPPGSGPGTQLQVKNPSTGQNMIVTVPPGVHAGDKFAVQN